MNAWLRRAAPLLALLPAAPFVVADPASWAAQAVDAAATLIAQVEDPLERSELQRRLGDAQAARGERAAAVAAFTQSLATVESLQPAALREWPRREVASALATAREFERAEAVTATIARREARDAAWADIAVERINAGDAAPARRAADRIRATPLQDETLRSIAAVLAARGEVDAAAETARAITGARIHGLALGDAAAAEATRGSLDQALAAASRIVDRAVREQAWVRVAAARARIGDAGGALKAARGVASPLQRGRALGFAASVAGVAQQPGLFAEAFELLRTARADTTGTVDALAEHARLRIAAVDRPGALAALRLALPLARPLGITDAGHVRLESLARLHVAAGDAATAQLLWRELAAGGGPLTGPSGVPAPRRGLPRSRDSVLLRDLIDAQVRTGDLEGARQFVGTIADPELRAIAYLGVVSRLVALKSFAGAARDEWLPAAAAALAAVGGPADRAPMRATLAVLIRDETLAKQALADAARFETPADQAFVLLDTALAFIGGDEA